MHLRVFALLILIGFNSCQKSEPDVPPVYVHIDRIALQTDYNTQGSASSNISDAWVYLDDSYFGTFSLPANFPVLLSGSHRIKICPGIKINGVNGSRVAYPFYTSFSEEIVFSESLNMNAVLNYSSNANIIWMEDFEKGLNSAGMMVEQKPELVFEGKGSGAVYLDHANTFAEFKPNSNFVFPKAGSPIYLELNYKSNLPFSVNVFSRTSLGVNFAPVGGGNPSAIWKKIYFNLTPAIALSPDAIDYGLSITVQNIDSSQSASLFLDNVKLVCLK
jgi:hypothetical protein